MRGVGKRCLALFCGNLIMNQPKKILIIDDEPKIIKALCDAFRFEEDFVVEGISDGGEALRCLENEKPDLVILDWRLSGEVQGRNVLQFIKAKSSEVPVWVVTASIHFLDEIKTYSPAASFLKPCPSLKEKIEIFFKQK